jgi:hypothetical protein
VDADHGALPAEAMNKVCRHIEAYVLLGARLSGRREVLCFMRRADHEGICKVQCSACRLMW